MNKKHQSEEPTGLRPAQKRFYRLLGNESPKPVHPKLVRIYGFPLAIIINQLLFWHGMGSRHDGFIYKTDDDFKKEIGLSPAQQRLAIEKGRDFGFLEVVRKGAFGKRHYKLHFQLLVECTVRVAKSKGIVLSKHYFEIGEKNRTITERTQETTPLNNKPESMRSILERSSEKL